MSLHADANGMIRVGNYAEAVAVVDRIADEHGTFDLEVKT